MTRWQALRLAGVAALMLAPDAVVSCDPGGADPGAADPGDPAVISVADHRRDGASDAEAIQAAIDAASPGDTVYFPGGTYELDRPFRWTSGVTYLGSEQPPAVLRGMGATSLVLRHDEETPLHDVTIRSLQFDNVAVHLAGSASYSAFRNITLQDCVFRNGRSDKPWRSAYIQLSYTVRVTIDGCTLLRDADVPGLGIRLYRSRLAVVKDSFIGTTADLEPGAPNGYFKTAINVFGYDGTSGVRNREVIIDGNVWRRTPRVDCPHGVRCEDHGLYAWGVDGLVVTGNYADGWTATGAGGSMKLRNSARVVVAGNHLMRSGIMMYTHWDVSPSHFSRVRVAGNRIDLLGNDGAAGIFYRRVDQRGSSDGRFCDSAGGEEDITILGNRLVGGGELDVRCADGGEICVDGNVGADLSLLAHGVRTAHCAGPDTWHPPLPGIHRGDFNGDGHPDFIHVAHSDEGEPYWRAHLSNGDGFVEQQWEYGVRLTAGSDRYGVHVADFTGDGRDDLAYRGVCGNERRPCWRVHHSTGTGLSAADDYGNGVRVSDETFPFGFHAGDYNGDGRADLAFRGRCGDDGHPCWRVLTARPDAGFAVRDWGDGVYWDPARSRELGLLVGDYNGDGRDDIAYPGRCASTQPCLRVHVSARDNTFRPQNWGDSVATDGAVTAHFGMRATDIDDDGTDDIRYRGRCGSEGEPAWRRHLGGAGLPFTISCGSGRQAAAATG